MQVFHSQESNRWKRAEGWGRHGVAGWPERSETKQDPNADTEWNDILCKKGILPSKESLKELEKEAEEEEQRILQQSVVRTYEDMTLEELQDNEDEFSKEDERAIEMYRQQRLAGWKATQLKNKFGEVLEISGKDYVQEVTKAGEGLWVVLHLYKQGIPLCALINQHLSGLARKFPDVTFVKAISTTCIPNYPDRNLPTVFVYLEGDIKAQLIGPLVFGGMNLQEMSWSGNCPSLEQSRWTWRKTPGNPLRTHCCPLCGALSPRGGTVTPRGTKAAADIIC